MRKQRLQGAGQGDTAQSALAGSGMNSRWLRLCLWRRLTNRFVGCFLSIGQKPGTPRHFERLTVKTLTGKGDSCKTDVI